MTNNDILRRLRYTFDYNDSAMMGLFALSGYDATREEISSWLKKDDDTDFKKCNDAMLARFLNGMIVDNRGRKEGEERKLETRLTNNIIFMKLKIALDLKAEEVLEMLSSAGVSVSKHELSALFRRPDHKHYRECKDQILRAFLKGAQAKYRGEPVEEDSPESIESGGQSKSQSSGFSWE